MPFHPELAIGMDVARQPRKLSLPSRESELEGHHGRDEGSKAAARKRAGVGFAEKGPQSSMRVRSEEEGHGRQAAAGRGTYQETKVIKEKLPGAEGAGPVVAVVCPR